MKRRKRLLSNEERAKFQLQTSFEGIRAGLQSGRFTKDMVPELLQVNRNVFNEGGKSTGVITKAGLEQRKNRSKEDPDVCKHLIASPTHAIHLLWNKFINLEFLFTDDEYFSIYYNKFFSTILVSTEEGKKIRKITESYTLADFETKALEHLKNYELYQSRRSVTPALVSYNYLLNQIKNKKNLG